MRIVLDINVLLISLPVASPYRPIFDALKAGMFELVLSNDILMEYHEKLAEKTSPRLRIMWLSSCYRWTTAYYSLCILNGVSCTMIPTTINMWIVL